MPFCHRLWKGLEDMEDLEDTEGTKKGSFLKKLPRVRKNCLLQNPECLAAGILCNVAELFLDPEELVVLCKSV